MCEMRAKPRGFYGRTRMPGPTPELWKASKFTSSATDQQLPLMSRHTISTRIMQSKGGVQTFSSGCWRCQQSVVTGPGHFLLQQMDSQATEATVCARIPLTMLLKQLDTRSQSKTSQRSRHASFRRKDQGRQYICSMGHKAGRA